MVSPRVKLDPAVSLGSVEKLREPLEDQLTSALQNAVTKVDDHYHGESVAAVEDELLKATKTGLHPDVAKAFTPDQEQLHDVAAQIVKDA